VTWQLKYLHVWLHRVLTLHITVTQIYSSRSQGPRGLRHRSAAARLLRLWVRIPPRAWMFVCCECCVLSGRGLCDELITRPEQSYRLWCVVVCDLETSWMRWPWPPGGCRAKNKQINSMNEGLHWFVNTLNAGSWIVYRWAFTHVLHQNERSVLA
jgi:hypothetical protein